MNDDELLIKNYIHIETHFIQTDKYSLNAFMKSKYALIQREANFCKDEDFSCSLYLYLVEKY